MSFLNVSIVMLPRSGATCMCKFLVFFFFGNENVFFPRPYVEYKGSAPQNEVQTKAKELELEANALISRGGKVDAIFFFFLGSM